MICWLPQLQLARVWLLSVGLVFLARTAVYTQGDTVILAYETYITTVLEAHPLARQANLQNDYAAANWMAARGRLDPTIEASWQDKYFDGKHYYRIAESTIRLPLRFGLAISGGYENTDGVFLNPERKTDPYGLWTLGVEANLLQGLLIDETRAAFRQAAVVQTMAENRRAVLINELIWAASLAYLEWQEVQTIQAILEESLVLAQTYFVATRTAFLQGEKTAVDTLEAALSVQDRIVSLQDNSLQLTKARQQLENFLWQNNISGSLPLLSRPQPLGETLPALVIPSSVPFLVDTNPDILQKEGQQAFYEIEGRLKRDKLKPKLKLKYQPLFATTGNSLAPEYSAQNYKWGVQLSFPVWFRSQRAELERNQIKIRETSLEIANKRNMLANKIEASLAQQATLTSLLQQQQQNVAGYRRLLAAENEKFIYGESSVFLLNKRQEKYISSQIKEIQIRAKFRRERLHYLYLTNSF